MGGAMGAREPVVVGYASALEFWRRSWLKGPRVMEELLGQLFPDALLAEIAECPDVLGEFPMLHPTASRDIGATDRVAGLLGISRPVDLVVENAVLRRQNKACRSHLWGQGLSAGLISHVEDNIYVCGPELAFLQLVSRFTRPELIELAYELCGDYVRLDGTLFGGSHLEGAGMTKASRLKKVCEVVGSCKCGELALQIASSTMENSWSPQESQLAAMMTLPRAQGGFGLSGAVMNKRVCLEKDLQRMAGRGYVVPDILYEEAGLCLEYQGGVHSEFGNRSSDDTKSNVLLMKGIQTIRIWKEQLYDIETLEAVADLVAKRLGIRRRPPSMAMLTRRVGLLSAFEASARSVGKS